MCACVCVRDRHTSVFAINLTLDSSFEHKPAHIHVHTLSVSKSELSSCQRPLSPPLPPRLSVKNCFPLFPSLLLALSCRPPSSFQSSLFSFCYSLSTCEPSIDIPVYVIKVLKLLLLTNARYCILPFTILKILSQNNQIYYFKNVPDSGYSLSLSLCLSI